jgi:hypothetical protein
VFGRDLCIGIAEQKLNVDLNGDGQVGAPAATKMSNSPKAENNATTTTTTAVDGDDNGLDDGSNIPLSTCTGNKKSLFIGINYKGTRSELKGCINDVIHIKAFVVERFRFPTDSAHMMTLTDDNPNAMPTRQNILNAFRWLVQDAQSGDSLFVHYSGHGTYE